MKKGLHFARNKLDFSLTQVMKTAMSLPPTRPKNDAHLSASDELYLGDSFFLVRETELRGAALAIKARGAAMTRSGQTGGTTMDSISTLISALQQCRALDAAQLDEVLGTIAPRCANPRALATELHNRRWLTPFQINRLFNGRGPELLVGGTYVLLERLGEGGMGQVFKARNWRLGKTVALKLIRKELVANPTAMGRFRREIEVTARLDHPNIIRAFDADQTDDGLFIVMEYVEGIDLGRLVQESGPVPIGEACDYVRQASVALQYAHEQGLIHRDIKPPNLLRADCGHVIKLLDLGLARLQEQADQALTTDCPALTQLGVILGTIDFIAPEQARNSSSVDIRADLYSLGCTFHFLLTGKPPFPSGTPTEKVLKHTLEPLPPLRHLPPRVTAVIHRLMAKKPEDRYQTPAEVVAVLEDLLANSGKILLARPAELVPQTVPTIILPPEAPLSAPRAPDVHPQSPRERGSGCGCALLSRPTLSEAANLPHRAAKAWHPPTRHFPSCR